MKRLSTMSSVFSKQEQLDRVISSLSQKLASMATNDYMRLSLLDKLSLAFQVRFDMTGSIDDLEQAIAMIDLAIASTPAADRASRLVDLATCLQTKYERNSSLDDLNQAITVGEQALLLLPRDDKMQVLLKNDLAVALQSRFQRTGLINDVDRAITFNKQILESTPVNDPSRVSTLNNLSFALQLRFEGGGAIEDLDQAIEIGEKAFGMIVQDDKCSATLVTTLAAALQIRYKCTGSLDNLNRAIALMQQALTLTSKEDPRYPGRLTNLGSALQERFEREGSIDDLTQAIELNENALAQMSDDYPEHTSILNNLAKVFHARFETNGSLDDLDRSIAVNKKVVNLTPRDHPKYSIRLNNLGNALQSRFERTDSFDDLEQAIKAKELGLDVIPLNHPQRGMLLNNLSISFHSRYGMSGSKDDLDGAISLSEEAVALTTIGHPDMAMRLSNLGAQLHSRFQESKSLDDLHRSIVTTEKAIGATPDGHISRGAELSKLGLALDSIYEVTGSIDELDRAIAMKTQGIDATPHNHPHRTVRLVSLGLSLERRFRKTEKKEDQDRALALYEQGLAIATAPPSLRIIAALYASRLSIAADTNLAKPFLRAAIELMPFVSPRALHQSDKQRNISRFAGITAQAVSVFLECGDSPYDALQYLELGRGVIAALQLEIRSNISDLKVSHPNLAQQFETIRYQLDHAIPEAAQTDQNLEYQYRLALSKQVDSLLYEIRQLEGFHRFLLGPTEQEIKDMAEDGAIVIFNVSDIRSDALIVSRGNIGSLPLPALKYTDLEAYSRQLLHSIETVNQNKYAKVKREMNQVLKWLWDVAAEPVLNELGFTQNLSETGPETSVWPRVWWVGSGLLSIMPIHAAGYHNVDPPRSTLDRVISSYIPTVKSLSYAREREWEERKDPVRQQKTMLIAMPQTPDKGELPFAEKEVQELLKLFPLSFRTTVVQTPTRETVLSVLGEHQIVHFACHGMLSRTDPSQSALLLADWKTSPLTVAQLTAITLPNPQLAFLSACHTANSKDLNLLDESISLSSAILLAGYPSVVATLWRISDNRSVEVARDVYMRMLQGDELETRLSAEGLHHAVRRLREATRTIPGFVRRAQSSDPLVWAPYIHLGV